MRQDMLTLMLFGAFGAAAAAAAAAAAVTQPSPQRASISVWERCAATLTVDDPVDGVRGTHCKEYDIHCEAGKTYVIDMASRTRELDPYLRLKDDQGRQYASDDDGGEGWNARIFFRCTREGTYTIVATTYADDTGDFTLTVRHPKRVSRTPLVLSGTLTAEDLNYGPPEKLCKTYPVVLTGGGTYCIHLVSEDNKLRPTLLLKNARGLVQRSGTAGPQLRFFCPETAAYIVVVTTANTSKIGDFQLRITRVD